MMGAFVALSLVSSYSSKANTKNASGSSLNFTMFGIRRTVSPLVVSLSVVLLIGP